MPNNLSVLEPTQNLALIIGVGLAIAISSATQDITIDALRIEQIKKKNQLVWQQELQWRSSDGGLDLN